MKTSLSTTKGRKRVTFEIKAEKGHSVYLAGSFNNWDAKQKKLRYASGVYRTSILLPRGQYEYKFVIDDTWCVDPECTEWAPNGVGSLNSVVHVN